jgi:hypothetical protein
VDLVLPDVAPSREQIDRLEAHMLQVEPTGGIALEAWHNFADGLVARTIRIPAGTLLTGAPHKAEHLNVCSGDITVWTEQGMRRLTGHHVIEALPGAKRVGMAHADTWWTTVHLNPGNERDIAALENALVEQPEMLQRRRHPVLEGAALEEIAP